MNTIFYVPSNVEDLSKLYRLMLILDRRINLKVFNSLDTLIPGIEKTILDANAAVLYAGSKNDLLDLIGLGYLLKETNTILILPDHEEETAQLGQKLTPFFLTYADSDFNDIRVMLTGIADKYASPLPPN